RPAPAMGPWPRSDTRRNKRPLGHCHWYTSLSPTATSVSSGSNARYRAAPAMGRPEAGGQAPDATAMAELAGGRGWERAAERKARIRNTAATVQRATRIVLALIDAPPPPMCNGNVIEQETCADFRTRRAAPRPATVTP